MIDRFAQPLRAIVSGAVATAGALGTSPRRQFLLGRYIYEAWFRTLHLSTRHWRVLPDMLLIGVTKGGTSSLAAYLSGHPDFYPPIYKESHYFDLNGQRDLSWYRAHFPLRATRWVARRLRRGAFLTGDFTPSYYVLPHGPEQVRRVLGPVKIVISLRNPIDRAYSHFRDSRRIGYEVLERFEDALAAEPIRLRGELERMEHDPAYCSEALLSFGYKTRGLYLDYLKRWRSCYSPQDMLILNFDDWVRAPQSAYRELCSFLGLRSVPLEQFGEHNVGSDRAAPLDAGVRERLARFFDPYNRALYDYLGVDYGWT